LHLDKGDGRRDDSLWKPMRGFFTPGTPLYNEEGGEILKGPRDFGDVSVSAAYSAASSSRFLNSRAQ
jgi:hypothetical protein